MHVEHEIVDVCLEGTSTVKVDHTAKDSRYVVVAFSIDLWNSEVQIDGGSKQGQLCLVGHEGGQIMHHQIFDDQGQPRKWKIESN